MTNKLRYTFGHVICFVTTLFIVFEYILRAIPSLSVSPLMQSFHANAFQIGFLGSIYYYSFVIMQLPAGILVDRFNIRYLVTIGVILCTVGVYFFSISHLLMYAELSRFLIGMGSSFAFICLFYLIKDWFQQQWFATYLGIYNALSCVFYMVFSPPLALAFDSMSWRQILLYLTYTGAILALLSFVVIRERPEKKTIVPTRTFHEVFSGAGQLLKKWRIWCITLISLFMFIPFTNLTTMWLIYFLQDTRHISTYQANFVVICFFAGFAVGGFILGILADHFGYRRLILCIANLLNTLLLVLAIYIFNLNMVDYMVLFFFIGLFTGSYVLLYYYAKKFSPITNTATAFSLINLGSLLGALIFQPLIGHMLDRYWQGQMLNHVRTFPYHAFEIAFIIVPVCTLIAAILCFAFKDNDQGLAQQTKL